jgi:hypothetical protein
MTGRAWIEMPAVRSASEDGRLRPKYSGEGRVVVVHHMGSAYVAFEDELAQQKVEAHADCRRLSASEARAFEQALPFPLPRELFPAEGGSSSKGLGDLVSWLMRMLGIRECRGCQGRRRRLNEFISWGWSRK